MISSEFIFPNQLQQEFIQVLISDDSHFPRLWKHWKRAVGDYQTLDSGSLRLFPLAYNRLKRLIPNDSWLKVTKNSHQAHWLKNQLLIANAKEIGHQLSERKIPFLVLKGGAYLFQYYHGDIGSRNVEDIDIFVPEKQFAKTIRLIKKQGWLIDRGENEVVFNPDFFHSISLNRGAGHVDIHCHVFHFYLLSDDWKWVWNESVDLMFADEKLRTLNDSDHLVHTLAHGLRASDSDQFHWIIDAIFIVRQGHIDWERVVQTAKKFYVTEALATALRYLSENFSLTVPEFVIEELLLFKVPFSYHRLYLLNLKNIESKIRPTLESYWWIYFNSLFYAPSHPHPLSQLILYMRYLTQTPTLFLFPIIFVKRMTHLGKRSVKNHIKQLPV